MPLIEKKKHNKCLSITIRGDKMSYRDHLDHRSELFNPTWARRKHAKAQVNGQTQQTQSLIILANEMRKRQT